ncbi:MFS general substrate transporter [Whalleya microplaca]|nr:MFS general substrate transporter [Whalleya microplaca]
MLYQHRVQGWRRTVLIATQLVGLLFSTLDASIVSTSLVSMAIDLQDFLNAPWVVLSYLLAYLGLTIGVAKLSDIYGRREMLCLSWALFAGFSIGCGCATNMTQLIICRAFQGIGGSGLYSLGQIVLFEVGPRDKPSLMGALVGITLAVSYVLGPILGGIISSITTWRWVFWINIPFGVATVTLMYLSWPAVIDTQKKGWDSVRKIDVIGITSILLACALLVFPLQEAGSYTYAWDSPVIVTAFSIAGLSWVVFFAWEIYLGLVISTRIEPILPLRLVFRRVYVVCVICTLCTGLIYLSILVILPERFQIVNGDNALYAGIHLLPMLGATAFGAFLAGTISHKRNNTSWTLMAAQVFQLIGVSLLSMLKDVTTETKAQYGYQVPLGFGIGLSLGAATIMASVQSQRTDLAVAQGAVAQARVFGGSIGIALCTIIFNTMVTKDLSSLMDPDDIAALHHSPTIAPWLPDDIQFRVRTVYASAFTEDIFVMIGIAAFGLVVSAFAYEKHPPPMPSVQQAKEVVGIDGHSETELDELVSVR